MRILIVSQMWPGPSDPDLGSFVATSARELTALGHTVERAVIDHRGGSRLKYPRLCLDAVGAARRTRPDVIFAHMLFPAGLAGLVASIGTGTPLVVMAHGADVANLGRVPGVTGLTRLVLGRACGLIVNSAWLGRALDAHIPGSAARAQVIDCGVDLDLFRPADASALGRSSPARTSSAWPTRSPTCAAAASPSSATARSARSSPAVRESVSSDASPSRRSPGGSPPATSSASRPSASRSVRPRSRRWPWSAR